MMDWLKQLNILENFCNNGYIKIKSIYFLRRVVYEVKYYNCVI